MGGQLVSGVAVFAALYFAGVVAQQPDPCPFVNGTAVSIKSPIAWSLINLLLTPSTTLQGPNQQTVFQLQHLFQTINATKNCLICYAYPSAPVSTLTRLLCDDNTDAYLTAEEQRPGNMHVFMTKLDLPKGYSADYECNIALYQYAVLNSTGLSTSQCWLRPLPE